MIPGDLVDAWESAKSRAQREGIEFRMDQTEALWNGQILEVLIAEYLAGPEYPEGIRADDASPRDPGRTPPEGGTLL